MLLGFLRKGASMFTFECAIERCTPKHADVAQELVGAVTSDYSPNGRGEVSIKCFTV